MYVLLFLVQFIADYGTDPEVTDILNNYNVYIMPSLNPDGYVYTHEEVSINVGLYDVKEVKIYNALRSSLLSHL